MRLSPCLAVVLPVALATVLSAQTQWTQVTAPMVDRHGHAMAYDLQRREVVMFGGNTGFGTWNDTFVFRNRQWIQRNPPSSPPPRLQHSMAYDFVRGRVVLFGGVDNSFNALGDTWEWDGTTWLQLRPANSPSPRYGAAMAFDFRASRVLLYSGGFAWPADTWEWDGNDWRNVTPPSSIQVRDGVMTEDHDSGRPLLCGSRYTTAFTDVYQWNGSAWTTRSTTSLMPGRIYTAVTYDARRERLMMFGGSADFGGTVPRNDTVELDGGNWLTRTPAAQPPPRYWHAMAYDIVNGETVLYGGRIQPNRLSDTWVYAPVHAASFAEFGAACRGSAGIPVLSLASGQPWLGDPIVFGVRGIPVTTAGVLFLGASDAQWGALALPLPLAVIGMPGCDLLVSPDLVLPFVAASGMAQVPLQICNCPELLGASVYQQAVIGDGGANALGLTVTNGGRLRIGGR